MSTAEALKAARAVGIRIEIDGDDLVLEASAAPPPSVLDLLSRHKAGIVTLLRPADDSWSAEDWQVFFDERAGIAEFDGGLSRGHAEAHAFGERHRLRAARRQAARAGPLFPLPTLLSPRPFEPKRERMGSRRTASEEIQTAPWRRP
jgi:hypothetical protein